MEVTIKKCDKIVPFIMHIYIYLPVILWKLNMSNILTSYILVSKLPWSNISFQLGRDGFWAWSSQDLQVFTKKNRGFPNAQKVAPDGCPPNQPRHEYHEWTFCSNIGFCCLFFGQKDVKFRYAICSNTSFASWFTNQSDLDKFKTMLKQMVATTKNTHSKTKRSETHLHLSTIYLPESSTGLKFKPFNHQQQTWEPWNLQLKFPRV